MTTTRETADHAELAACPFCGGTATIERFGNTRVSTQYHCDDCGCFLETGEEFHHGREWNRRPREAALLSEIAALRGERDHNWPAVERLDLETRLAEQAGRATQAERQRDELRKALEPFAALADKFGCWSVVEVCAPEPGNTSPVIQPVPLSAFETAAALIANQGADQ